MVFYPLVIRDAVGHYRRIGTLMVGTQDCPKPQRFEDTVDALLRKPTMAVKKVSFRGWYFSPLPNYPDSSQSGRSRSGSGSLRDETLGETLNRMRPGETLRDVFSSSTASGGGDNSGGSGGARRRRRRDDDGDPRDRPHPPRRANASLLHGEGEEGAARRIRTTNISHGSHGSSSVSEEERIPSSASASASGSGGGSMRTPSFRPVDATTAPSRGCMRIQTLEESLAITPQPSSSDDNSQESPTTDRPCPSTSATGVAARGLLRRMSPRVMGKRRRKGTAPSGGGGNNNAEGGVIDSRRALDLGNVRFGRTGSLSSRIHAISYGTVEVREYVGCMGDHPACSEGPPISLGWSFRSQSTAMSVDDYESHRPPPTGSGRNVEDSLLIPKERRERILRKLGYSYEDIMRAIVDKRFDQVCRERTLCRLRYQAFDERMEEFRSSFAPRLCARVRT